MKTFERTCPNITKDPMPEIVSALWDKSYSFRVWPLPFFLNLFFLAPNVMVGGYNSIKCIIVEPNDDGFGIIYLTANVAKERALLGK